MIWILSDMIMGWVIRDAPVKVASNSSTINPARGCLMLWDRAVNIHPQSLFYVYEQGYIYLKFLQINFLNGQSA